jgi:hypothetical protein
MRPEEIEKYRRDLGSAKLSDRWVALALLTKDGLLQDAELCEAVAHIRDAPPRSSEKEDDLESLASALSLALSRMVPPNGARLLFDIIQRDAHREAGANPLGWVWAAKTLMDAYPAHALVMLREAVLSGVGLPRPVAQSSTRPSGRKRAAETG